jgi:hypothetical protein
MVSNFFVLFWPMTCQDQGCNTEADAHALLSVLNPKDQVINGCDVGGRLD